MFVATKKRKKKYRHNINATCSWLTLVNAQGDINQINTKQNIWVVCVSPAVKAIVRTELNIEGSVQ